MSYLDNLRPEVQEALRILGFGIVQEPSSPFTASLGNRLDLIRVELLRLVDMNATIASWYCCNSERLHKVETELAALKARIEDAPMAAVRTVTDGMGGITRTYVCRESQSDIGLPSLDGKRVHLVVEE